MKKEWIISIFAILAVALLTSCNGKDEPNKEKQSKSIVGTWEYYSDFFENVTTFHFRSNGTGTVTDTWWEPQEASDTFKWEILSESVMKITMSNGSTDGEFLSLDKGENILTFKIEGNHLILQIHGSSYILTKVK